MISTILIVGGGQAGAQAIDTLRREGGGELLAVEAINHSKYYTAARKLIGDRIRPNLDKLADPQTALKDAI